MIARIIALLIFCLPCGLLPAQTLIGIEAGSSYSDFFNDGGGESGEVKFHNKFQPFYAVFLKQKNHEHFNLNTKVTYLQREVAIDASYSGVSHGTTSHGTYKAQYIYAALIPELSFGKVFSFNIGLGPSAGFLIHSEKEASGSSWVMASSSTWDEQGKASEFSNSEFRMNIKTGVDIRLNQSLTLSFDQLISRNISSTMKGFGGQHIGCNDFMLSLGLGYRIKNFSYRIFPKPKKHE